MKNNRFNFCPECGSKKIQTLMNGRKWLCPDCGFDLYNNVASAVGLLILNSRGEILMEKRAKEPRKGFL
ncbi:MAG: NUDIX hydrolase, partial [Treponema sp.]|nr:NUDIX hydrolase [Treponema sp.]